MPEPWTLPGPARLLAGAATLGPAPLLCQTPPAVRVTCTCPCTLAGRWLHVPRAPPPPRRPFSSTRKLLKQSQENAEGWVEMKRCPAPAVSLHRPSPRSGVPLVGSPPAARAPLPWQSSRSLCREQSDGLGVRHRSRDGCVSAARSLQGACRRQMAGGHQVSVQPGSLLAAPSCSGSFPEGCTGARSWAGWAWHLGFAARGMRDAPLSSESRQRSPAPTCRWLRAVASLPWNKDGFIPVISV